MWHLFILALLGSVSGEGAVDDFNVINKPKAHKVVGGEEVEPNSWPWQISLQYTYPNAGGWAHTCGGSLISPFWAMTAAHCVDFDDGATYRVALGEHNLFGNEGIEYHRTVDKVIIHQQWTGSLAKGFDIALLHLERPAFDSGTVKIAVLPQPGDILPSGFPCYITGWGLTESGGEASPVLLQALLPVIDTLTCSTREYWDFYSSDKVICAGGDGSLAGCHGDSGGPLNCLIEGVWQVHGIASFGPFICNTYKKPTVFTRVSDYIGWIWETMESNGGAF